MGYEQIEVEDRDEVRVVTLHRPDKLNAWTWPMQAELVRALRDGNDDPAVGAFVVTGSGRGFCAGADVTEVFAARGDGAGDGGDGSGDRSAVGGAGDWVTLVRASKPVVAAINGPAIGIGVTLVLPMDFLVATPEAKISLRFVKMGVVPELASSHFLVQRCGWGTASDLALSGRTVLGDEALGLGLVDEVADDVVGAAIARARSYAENAPASVRLTKRLLTQNAAETDLALVQQREVTALEEAYRTPEHREAIAAFAEKRAPVFR